MRATAELPSVLWAQTATVAVGTAQPPFTALSTGAAAAVDVIIRDSSTAAIPPAVPFLVVRVYAHRGSTKTLVATLTPSAWPDGGWRIRVRDTPAESYDVVLDASLLPGDSAVELVAIGWGTEPTGIGPQAITTVQDGESWSTAPANPVGIPVMGASTDGNWRHLHMGYQGPGLPSAMNWLNTLPGAVYNSVPPAPADGQMVALQCDSRGALNVCVTSAGGAPPGQLSDADANSPMTRMGADLQLWHNAMAHWERARCNIFGAVGVADTTGLQNTIPMARYTAVRPALADGEAWSLQLNSQGDLSVAEQFAPTAEDNADAVLAVAMRPLAVSTYSATPVDSTALEASHVLKAAPGNLYRLQIYNNNAAARWFQLHDAAALPADGAVPRWIYYLAGQSSSPPFDWQPGGRYFTTGIVVCGSTTGPTKTLGAADFWFSALVK